MRTPESVKNEVATSKECFLGADALILHLLGKLFMTAMRCWPVNTMPSNVFSGTGPVRVLKVCLVQTATGDDQLNRWLAAAFNQRRGGTLDDDR